MTSTLQHAEIGAPRSNGVTILVGQYAGELMQVSEVVSGPGCKKFRKRNHSQPWMRSVPSQVLGLQIHRLKRGEVLLSQAAEIIQQLL